MVVCNGFRRGRPVCLPLFFMHGIVEAVEDDGGDGDEGGVFFHGIYCV